MPPALRALHLRRPESRRHRAEKSIHANLAPAKPVRNDQPSTPDQPEQLIAAPKIQRPESRRHRAQKSIHANLASAKPVCNDLRGTPDQPEQLIAAPKIQRRDELLG